MEDDPIVAAVHSIKAASAQKRYAAMPAPGPLIDVAIDLLKTTEATYLPTLIHVLQSLRAIVPG